MSRIMRALVYAVLVVVGYHALRRAALSSGSPAAQVLDWFGHGKGFTLALAAGCAATKEFGLLAVIVLVLFVIAWPLDLLAVAFALAGGIAVGSAIRSLVHSEDRERQATQR
jgi:high-affinity Fe2+/Pb2+ permease